MKHFERDLPEGYREIYRINALDVKVGLIMNLIAGVIILGLIVIGFIPIFLKAIPFDMLDPGYLIAFISLIPGFIIYMVWHELMHGVAYKLLTGEKLTFGISWSCAYCGVPNIYVYRKASLIALLTPFVVCGVILTAATVILAFVNTYAYLALLIITASHFGGCIGDLWIALLFLFKMKDKTILMRDTGPEQTFYIKD